MIHIPFYFLSVQDVCHDKQCESSIFEYEHYAKFFDAIHKDVDRLSPLSCSERWMESTGINAFSKLRLGVQKSLSKFTSEGETLGTFPPE